jgi:hypothetical protein
MCGKLERAYLRRASEEFEIPNPQLIRYREASAWLKYAAKRSLSSWGEGVALSRASGA